MNRSTKKVAFLDRFIKNWCCSSRNHPEGWAWWKRKARKDTRRKIKNYWSKELCELSNQPIAGKEFEK